MRTARFSRAMSRGAKASSPASRAYRTSRSRWARQTWCSLVAQPICAARRSETQKAGRTSPRNAATTALPREGRMAKQALSPWWKTQAQKVRWPTRTEVSSDCRTVPDSRRRRMAPAWIANAGALSASMAASAPSLTESPNRSASRPRRRPRQARERDRLAEAQVEDEGAQVRPERRARLEPGGRRRLEPPVAAGAGAAVERHPGDVRRDPGNVYSVVGLERCLARRRQRRPAVRAALHEHVAPPGRLGVQRPVRPRVDLALGPRLGRAVRLVASRGRGTGVARRLGRPPQLLPQRRVVGLQRRVLRLEHADAHPQGGVLGLQRRDTGREPLDPRQPSGGRHRPLGPATGGFVDGCGHARVASQTALRRNRNRRREPRAQPRPVRLLGWVSNYAFAQLAN